MTRAMHLTKYTLPISVAVLCGLCGCANDSASAHGGKKEKKAEKLAAAQQGAIAEAGSAGQEISYDAPTGCDVSLWKHVYNPARLQQLSPCISVTGTVDESNADDDGDQHFLVKLDPGQPNLVNKRNQKKKNGDLVGEIVCANAVILKKAKLACAGYTNSIAIPKVGERVRMTGTYVIDLHNGWAEVHPVSKLEKM